MSSSSSSSSSSYIDNWSSSSSTSSSTEWMSSSSSSSIDSSSSSSSSSYLDYHGSRTIPFLFEKDTINPITTMVTYKEEVYAGTSINTVSGVTGMILKSQDRWLWSKVYSVDDVCVTALYIQDNKMYIGTAPEGKIYILNLDTNALTLSQTIGDKIVGFSYFQGKLYVAVESPPGIYVYDPATAEWSAFYTPYRNINKVLTSDKRMYLLLEGENLAFFDGNNWNVVNTGMDNIASFRNLDKEPVSRVTYNLLSRTGIKEVSGLQDEEIIDIFPLRRTEGIKSGVIDGITMVVGGSNYGRIYSITDTITEIFQTDKNTVYAMLNLDLGVNLAAIDNRLYLIYCGAIPESTTTTTSTPIPAGTTTTTTTEFKTMFVSNPAGGEAFTINDTVMIRWSSTKGINDAVKIDLYKSGALVQNIITSTSNSGEYEWIVPQVDTYGSDYSIVITWLSSGTVLNENVGYGNDFGIFYVLPATTTTTTTQGSVISSQIPDTTICSGIPILELPEDEYILDMIKDQAKGGILFATSKGRILTCRQSVVNAYLTGERKVYAEVQDGFGNVSETASTNFFYAMYNKIAEINQDKEVVKWKYEVQPSATPNDRINGTFLSPILFVKEDLGFWKQLVWTEIKPDNTDIIVYIRAGNSEDDVRAKQWDNGFSSTDADMGTVSRSLDNIGLDGKYIQFKVEMMTESQSVSPSIVNLTITYSTKLAMYFFTVKFSLERDTNLKRGMIVANITEPQNTEIRFGVASKNSVDWNDYTVIEPNKFFDMDNIDNVKIGIKMVSYAEGVPVVGEFAFMAGGDKDNLIGT